MSIQERSRPGTQTRTASQRENHCPLDDLILPELPLSDADEIARHVDGALVVVVEVSYGKYRRRCFLTAKAAERAVGNARRRGQSARVYLAELKPLYRVPMGGEPR